MPAAAAERGQDLSSAGHSRGQPLQLEGAMAAAGKGGADSERDPAGWGATDKFTVVLETAGLNTTELSAYCRERGLYPEHVVRWRQASQGANEKPVLTL